MERFTATEDPNIAAVVTCCRPMRYAAGADRELDRPDHVRAGSSMAWWRGSLAVIQDDANFVALVDPDSLRVEALVLPVGDDGGRQFDDVRGNKRFKLDLEACVVAPDATDEPVLLAFGSGSSPLRERVLSIRGDVLTLHNAASLYALLRSTTDFAGSDMNIEGALFTGMHIRLFGRGNGAARGALQPLDATCDLLWPQLRAYLWGEHTAPPAPTRIRQYQLGTINGSRLTFTDAAYAASGMLFAATAEDSPDATRDGPVAGSALGVISEHGETRWITLRTPDGAAFDGKVEGVALDRADPMRAFIVLDRDDPQRPSELCEVELRGPWWE